MGSILVWGKARDLVVGELPATASLDEVPTLADLQQRLEFGGGPLVLVDGAHLEPEREGVEAWLKEGGTYKAIVVGVADPGEADELLRRYPFLDDIFTRPVSPGYLRLRLERAL